MNYGVRELSVWERAALFDTIQKLVGDNVMLAIEVISRAVEIEGSQLVEKTVAGRKIRMMSDDDLERLLAELTAEDISKLLQEVFEKNKLPFLNLPGKTD